MRRILSCLLLLWAAACVEELDPPAYGVYQVNGLVAEVTGQLITPAGTSTLSMVLPRTAFSGPSSQPDFVTSPSVPTCFATSFSDASPPGGNDIDGGDLVFANLRPTDSFDVIDVSGNTGTATIRNPITCTQIDDDPFYQAGTQPLETDIRHNCDSPALGAYDPRQTIFGPGTSVTISATGGTQSGAFVASGLLPPPALSPTESFDLNAVDTRGPITAQWIPVEAPLALVEIIATRADGFGVQILCLELMSTGQVTIPDGALALAPEPTAGPPPLGNFVTVITSMAAVNSATSNEGWGTYLVGVGRGRFGTSILVAP